jgi:dTDP-glucose 4,6-dehydratase
MGLAAERMVVTGGSGFIGSAFLNKVVPAHPEVQVWNFDKLTYAAHPLNLAEIERLPNYHFTQLDLADREAVFSAIEEVRPDWIVHFAAETHVDRSIVSPEDFLAANVIGTFNLLDAARRQWKSFEGKVFHHVSTDEVYGSLEDDGAFTERTPYDPSSPYSASKAASDHYVRAFGRTYGMPVRLSNCSNNFGPRQFPEKLIPLTTLNCEEGKPLPVYGKGLNVRDWLFVDDHVDAILRILESGRDGETYNVGGGTEMRNIEIVQLICDLVAEFTGTDPDEKRSLITFVQDRPGHDYRYAIDSTKMRTELGWEPAHSFREALGITVRWYLEHREWLTAYHRNRIGLLEAKS